MSSKGTHMGGAKTVTYKGHMSTTAPKSKWMYQLLAKGMSKVEDTDTTSPWVWTLTCS